MTLHMLAVRVPVNKPWINSFPELLLGAPGWKGQIQTIPKQTGWDYEQVINTLTKECYKSTIINVFCNGILSNRGCLDGKQVRATLVALY
jgi:hypothetical protein